MICPGSFKSRSCRRKSAKTQGARNTGAEMFKRDLPDADIHLLDAGHFALDEKNDEIASLILAFLAKHCV